MSDDGTLGGFRFGQNYDPSELDTPKKDFGTKNTNSEFKGIRFTFRIERDKKKGVKLVINYQGKEEDPCDDEYDIILRKGDVNLLNDSEFDLDKALDLARNSVRVIAIHKQHVGDFEHISVEKGEFTETPDKGKWDTIKNDPNARLTKANTKESLSSKVNKVYNKIINSINDSPAAQRSGTLERREDRERVDIDRRKDPAEDPTKKRKTVGGDDDDAALRKKLADDIGAIDSPEDFSGSIDKLVERIKLLEEQIGTIGGSDIETTRQQIELLKKKLEELKQSGSIQEDDEKFQRLKKLLLAQSQRLEDLELSRAASSGDEHHDLSQDPRALIRAFQHSELKLGFPLDETHYESSNELTPESLESLASSYTAEDAREALEEISSFKKDLCSNKESRFLPEYKKQVKMYKTTFAIKSLESSKAFLKGLPSQAQGPMGSFREAVIKLRGDDLPELSNLKALLLGKPYDLTEAAQDFISFFDLVNATDAKGDPKYETAHTNWGSFVYITQPRYEKDENGVRQAIYNFSYRRDFEIFSDLIAARNQADSQMAVPITAAVYNSRLNALEKALTTVTEGGSTKTETKADTHETRDVNDVSFDYDDASGPHATPLDWVHLYQMRQKGDKGERIFQSKKAKRHAFNETLNTDNLGDLGSAYQRSRSVLEDLKAEQIEESEKACRRFDETVEELSKDDTYKIEHKALTTGDNLTAELRKQIAAGEVPDWDIDEELIDYMDRLVTSKGSKAGVVTALPGSGKTFGAKAFAKAVMEGKTSLPKGTQVIMLTKEIVEGINEPNMSFAGVLGKVIKKWENSDPPAVIIADEAHNWMKKLSWVGSSSLMESLKTAVEEKKIRVIGLTTPLEYKLHFNDSAIIRRFPEKIVRDSLPEDIARRLQFSKEFVDRPKKVEYTPGQIYTASLLVKKYRSLASALADGDPNEKQEVSLVSRTLKSFDSMLTQAEKNDHSSLEIGDIVSTLAADNNVKLPIAEEDVEEYKLAGALFDIKHYFAKMVEEAFEGKSKIYLDEEGNSLLNNPEALKRKLKEIYIEFSTLTSSVGNKEVLAYSHNIAKALETAKGLLSDDDDDELDFIIESSLADGIQAVRIKKDKAEKDKAAIEQQTLSTHVAFTEGSYEAGKATRGAQELAALSYHRIPGSVCHRLDSSLQGLLKDSSDRNITHLGVDSVVSDAKAKLEQFVDNQEQVYEKKRAILEQQQNLLEGEIAKIQEQRLDPAEENAAIYPYEKLFNDITTSLSALEEAKEKVENRIQAFEEELKLLEEMSAHLKGELAKAKKAGAKSLKLLLCTELEKPEDLTLEEAKKQSLLNFLKINLFSKFRSKLRGTNKGLSRELEAVLNEPDGGKPSCAVDFTRLLRDGFSSILPDAKAMGSEAPEHIPLYKKEEEVKDEESGEMKKVTYDSTDLLGEVLDNRDNFDYYTPANIASNAFKRGKKTECISALANFLKEIGLIDEDKHEEINSASTEEDLKEALEDLFITTTEVSSDQMDKRKVDALLFILYNLDKKAKSSEGGDRAAFRYIEQLFGQEEGKLSTHSENALANLDEHFTDRPFDACFREQYFQLDFSKISWAKELSCVPGWEKKNLGNARGAGNSSSRTSPAKGGSPSKRSPGKKRGGGVDGQTEDFKAQRKKSPGKKTEKAEAFSALKDTLSNSVKDISSKGSLSNLPIATLSRYLDRLLGLKESIANVRENYEQAEAFCSHWESEVERLHNSLKLLIAVQEKIAGRANTAQNELIESKLTEEERTNLPDYLNRKESELRLLAGTIHSNLDSITNEVQLEFKLATFNLEAQQEEMRKANAKERKELEARIFKQNVMQKLGAFKKDENLAKEVRRQGKQLAAHAKEIIKLGEDHRSISQILDLIRNVRARVEVNTRDIAKHSEEQAALLEEAQKAGLDRARIQQELSELAAVREKEQVELQTQLEELTSIYESDKQKFEAQQEETHKLVAGMLNFRTEELDNLEDAEERIAAMKEKFDELSKADIELQALGEQADKSANLQSILDAKEELKRQMQLKMQELESKKDDLTRKIEAADRDISGKISAAKIRISDLQGELERAVKAAEEGIEGHEAEAKASFKRLQTSLRKELKDLVALEIKRPSTTNVHELYEQYEKHVADMNRSLEAMVQNKEGDVKTYLEEAEAEFTTLREQLTEEFSKVVKKTLKRPSTENVAKYNRLLQERQAFYQREIEKLKAKGETEASEKYQEALRELSEQYTSISDELQAAVDNVKVSALKRPSLETINHYQEMLKLKRTTLQKEIETLTELKTREAQERLTAATAELEAQFQSAKENIDTVLAKVKVEAIDRP
ncbi:MAG: hypothetical protein L7U87_05130, partial [Chlamydiales bacterium]|nr:hypothetical protein [Chlamydiales bacterium]